MFGWSEQDKRAETGKARFVLILLPGLTPLKVSSEWRMRTGCAGFVSPSTGAFCSAGQTQLIKALLVWSALFLSYCIHGKGLLF